MPNTASTSDRLPYLPGLDGVRALSVLAVFFYHANCSWAVGGFLGVESFFVISGYLITSLLLREALADGRLALGRFWLRRARRLLPALWLVLAAVAVFAWLWAPEALPRLREDIPAALLYGTNWLFIFRQIPYFEQFGRPPLLQHLWSLAVEEQFYLVWPLAVGLMLRGLRVRQAGQAWRLVLPLLAGVALGAAWLAALYDPAGDPARVYYGTDTRAAGFLLGAALAAVRGPGQRLGRWNWLLDAAGTVGLAGLVWSFTHLHEYQAFLYRGGFLLTAAFTGLIVLAVSGPETRLARLLGSSALRWVGTRSYGVYLWHWPVLVLSGWSAGAAPEPGVVTAVQLVTTFALADLSYRWVEQPIRQAGFKAWLRALWLRRGALRASVASVGGLALLAAALTFRPGPATLSVALANAAPSETALAPLVAPPTPTPTVTALIAAPAPTQTPRQPVPMLSAPVRRADLPIEMSATGAQPSATSTRPVPTPSPRPASIAQPTAQPAWPTQAAAPTSEPTPVVAVAPLQATLIGDSVMETARPWLEPRLEPGAYYLDARLNRRMGDALALIPELAARGRLAGTVLIHLGTNQPFDASVFDAVMWSLVERGVARVIFVTVKRPIGWVDLVNQQLVEGVARWPQARLADWNGLAQAQAAWFVGDQVHPNPTGAEAYTRFLLEALTAP